MTHREHDPDPFRSSLEEWDGEYPESWIPQPGEILVGQLVRYDRGQTTYGDCQIAVVLDEDTGEERSVWLLHEVLRREFLAQRPRIGERIGLKRLEDARNSAGQPYQKWALRVDRKGAPPPELDAPTGSGGEVGETPPDPSLGPFATGPDPDELEDQAAAARAARQMEDDGLPF